MFETSKTFKISKPFKPIIDKAEIKKPFKSIKFNNKILYKVSLSLFILLFRAQHKECFRKKAIELDKNPSIFITITEKDRLDSITFQNRIKTDSQICNYTKKVEENSNEYMDITVQKRLIEEEIICCRLEDNGMTISWLDTNKK
ncbi:8191_t:CDS:1 [Cetraspora pellucida]|uniref:8191_t:CDS:1 n=1 Tax=Cetraspora pellucida TaxID=1433469 RepID=A0A9N9IZ36_9GLOM|nr:8191_t:CDS:1 [Cetraspora pellucida]